MSLLNLFGWSKKWKKHRHLHAAQHAEQQENRRKHRQHAAQRAEQLTNRKRHHLHAASALRSARRDVLHREMQEHRITSVRNTVCIVETALSTVRYRQ